MRKVRLGLLLVVVGVFIAVSGGRGHAATALPVAARDHAGTYARTNGHRIRFATHAGQQEVALFELRSTRDSDGSRHAYAVPVGPNAGPRLHSRPGPKLAHCDNGASSGATLAPSRAPPRTTV